MHRFARVVLVGLLAVTAACSTDSSSVERAQEAPDGSSAPPAPSAAGSASPSAAAEPSPSPSPTAPPELPRGGRSVFPRHMVVMAYGTAGTGVLGVLGEVPPDEAAKRLIAGAVPYAEPSGRVVLPAFELITTVAQRAPGDDGLYSRGLADEDVQRYLDAARKAQALLVLDFQPGRADVLDQVKRYEKFLLEPEVGVALDPEWVLQEGQRPGRQIGRMDAATVNRVSAYLSELTVRNGLPEKIFLVHQFKTFMLPDREQIADRPGLALVFHVDGFGPRGSKQETYDLLSVKPGDAQPGGVAHNGFKLFLDEDPDLLSPLEVMTQIVPRPELVSYQ